MSSAHAHDPYFYICCGVDGCSRTYCNFYSFKKHLYRKHRGNLDLPVPFIANAMPETTSMEDEAVTYLDIVGNESSSGLTAFQRTKQIALFLLKTKEVRKVSQTALDGIIPDFTELLQQRIYQLKTEVKSYLEVNGMNIAAFEGLERIFDDPQKNNPFRQLDSKFLQEKFYREYLNLLVSLVQLTFTLHVFNIRVNIQELYVYIQNFNFVHAWLQIITKFSLFYM